MISKSLPSVFTIGNLVLGVLALILSVHGNPSDAALLVIIGMVLDGLDGRIARWLHAESNFGKELDSLSDIVTFGIAPAFIMYNVVLHNDGWFGIAVTALFPVCGALRLARFNVQKTSSRYFVGLPITAAGGVLAAMSLYDTLLAPAEVIMPIGMIILSLLMISKARYPNFKRVRFPRSTIVVVPILAIGIYLIFRFHHAMANRLIFVPLALYALFGIGRMWRRRKAKRHEAQREFQA